jgi:hypothetical protein
MRTSPALQQREVMLVYSVSFVGRVGDAPKCLGAGGASPKRPTKDPCSPHGGPPARRPGPRAGDPPHSCSSVSSRPCPARIPHPWFKSALTSLSIRGSKTSEAQPAELRGLRNLKNQNSTIITQKSFRPLHRDANRLLMPKPSFDPPSAFRSPIRVLSPLIPQLRDSTLHLIPDKVPIVPFA